MWLWRKTNGNLYIKQTENFLWWNISTPLMNKKHLKSIFIYLFLTLLVCAYSSFYLLLCCTKIVWQYFIFNFEVWTLSRFVHVFVLLPHANCQSLELSSCHCQSIENVGLDFAWLYKEGKEIAINYKEWKQLIPNGPYFLSQLQIIIIVCW